MKTRKLLILTLASFLVAACQATIQPTVTNQATERPTGRENVGAPTLEAEQVKASQIAVENLRNATYTGIYDGPITLTDGLYEGEPYVEGDPSRPVVKYLDEAELFGDLDGDEVEDAVVFLTDKGGGSATFMYVAAQLNRDGQPVDAGAVMVEDRTQVLSADIKDGKIVLEFTTRGPDGVDCCPSYKTRKIYTLAAGRLVEVPVENPELVKISADDLNSTSWTLLELDDATQVMPDTRLTITFQEDQLSGFGGCNNFTSSFDLDELNPFIMTTGPIVTTRKACPEPVLDQEKAYFTALENVSLWGYMFGKLVLAYPDGQGGLKRMLFTPSQGN